MKRTTMIAAAVAMLGSTLAGTALAQVEEKLAPPTEVRAQNRSDVVIERIDAVGGGAGGIGNGVAANVRWTAAIAGKKEKVTYLGLVTSPAQAAVREQLKLAKGVALVIDQVEPKSPAEAAGVKQHDVLEKLNDQLIINAEQLTSLIRSMKAGDEVTLTVVRTGERQALKAKLVEKEIELGAEMNVVNFVSPTAVAANGVPAHGWLGANRDVAIMDANGGRGVMRVDAVGGGGGGGGGFFRLDPQANDVVLRQINVTGKQTTEWADADVRITLQNEGDKTTNVTLTDAKTGKVLMNGKPPVADDPFMKAHPELAPKLAKAAEAAKGPQFLVANTLIAPGVPGVRGKVVQWQDGDHVLVMRMMGTQPTYLLALSKKDGRTIYDGPVMTDEQRKGVPAEVAEQFEMVAGRPEMAKEFGGADAKAAKEPKAPKEAVLEEKR